MKVTVKLAQGKYYRCKVKADNQLDAAAKAAIKGRFYGLIPLFIFKLKYK